MSDDSDRTEVVLGSEPTPQTVPRTRVLGGRYLLEERVASGGMASVWRAHDEKLARTVAVKVLHEHLTADDSFRERFRREAVAAARLSHPNIVGMYDTGTDGEHIYLVMEFIEGITLKDVLNDSGPLDVGRAARIGEHVARALAYAHARGLVHRDVKPANILIGEDGVVKVADFGIAKAEEADSDLTKTGMVLGTAAYVAPEQILAQPLDGRADQYGLGCVLYESLSGQQPFKGDSPVATAALRLEYDPYPIRSLRPEIPRDLDDIVMQTLARDPDDRFSSAAVLADALAPWADADTAETAALLPGDFGAPPTSFLRTEGRWLGPVLTILIMAGVLAGVGLATGVIETVSVPNLLARDNGPDGAEAVESTPIGLDADGLQAFDPVELVDSDRPGGDGAENDDRLPRVLDDDPETYWRADLYDTSDFGGLKPGVGFSVDLGGPHMVERVQVTTPSPGISFQLRVAGEYSETVSDWEVAATVTDSEAETSVELSEPVEASHLLVYVVAPLQRFDGRWSAAISGLAVEGRPQ